MEDRLAAELRRAAREIRVAMFHFTSDRMAQALAERRRAGLSVRVLLDASQADDSFVRRLRADGIEVRLVVPRGEESSRFHHKYAVLDGRIVATGSYNWTVMADIANHENLVILRDEAAARAYREDFERASERFHHGCQDGRAGKFVN